MRKVAKGNQRIFNAEVEKLFLGYGAKEVTDNYDRNSMKTFELQTKAGLLTVSLPLEHTYTLTVFSKFAEPNRASELLGKDDIVLNHFSGKYNFHLGNPRQDTIKTDIVWTLDCAFSKLL